MNRLFYTTYAWAYDLLIRGPINQRVEFIESQLGDWRILPGACLLDAGCGTGTYTIALAKKGFRVTGIDPSADLIEEAKRKTAQADICISFVMRCWTQEELGGLLISAGFDHVEYFGDYDAASPIGSTDRLVVVARLEEKVD